MELYFWFKVCALSDFQVTTEQKDPWLKRFRQILSEGWETNPLPKKPPKKKRGRQAKTKSQNLLTRLVVVK